MVTITSPFPAYALPRVWRWMQSFRGRVMDDYSPQTEEAFIDKAMADAESARTWGVLADGELGGMVTFQQWTPILGTCHCLFKKELWGREITHTALSQIATEIFAGETRKISMCVFSDNTAIRALLAKLGAVVEGTYRKHTMRGGQLADMTILALFKEKFNAIECSRSGDRGDILDRGVLPVGQAQDADKHVHPDVLPGDAGSTKATA